MGNRNHDLKMSLFTECYAYIFKYLKYFAGNTFSGSSLNLVTKILLVYYLC